MCRGDEGVTTLRVAADLQQATVALPEIHGRKEPGTEGSLSLLVELGADDRPLAYRDVVLLAGDLMARGNATPAGDGEGLAAIALERIAFELGRAHVLTPVANAHLVCRLLLKNKNVTSSAKVPHKSMNTSL